MKKVLVVMLACLILVPAITSCSKTSTETESMISQTPSGSPSPTLGEMGTIEIDIQDAPPSIPADHIFITFNDLEIHQSLDSWISIPTPNTPFDLKNMMETTNVLTTQVVDTGSFNEIRLGIASVCLQFGTQTYNATVPSGTIRMVGDFDIANDKTTTVVLDIDGDKSINVTGNNQYTFKPVLHFITGKANDVLSISTFGVANDLVGINYRDRISALGGKKPYTFSVASGSLPPGINLDSKNGVLSGSPSQVGTYDVIIKVQDTSSPVQSDSAEYTVRILPLTSVVIQTTSLPDGLLNEPYDANLSALGGNGIYTWKLSGGTLPLGLLLDVTAGTISGTTTQSGDYSFNLTVQDGSNPPLMDSQSFTIHVE